LGDGILTLTQGTQAVVFHQNLKVTHHFIYRPKSKSRQVGRHVKRPNSTNGDYGNAAAGCER
jgi:hypothetical protein